MGIKTPYQGIGCETSVEILSKYQSAFKLCLQVVKHVKENEKWSKIFRNFSIASSEKSIVILTQFSQFTQIVLMSKRTLKSFVKYNLAILQSTLI